MNVEPAAQASAPRPAHKPKQKQQFSSMLLFAAAVLLVNLCPFEQHQSNQQLKSSEQQLEQLNNNGLDWGSGAQLLGPLDASLRFVQLMFSDPARLCGRRLRYTQAEARMLKKMVKVWYLKKEVKKLGKKLKKKKTIVVPVFTTIPIYEHSYHPHPHVTHMSHGAMHHHAAASSLVPTYVQLASAAQPYQPQQQDLATSASSQYPMAVYRRWARSRTSHRPEQRHRSHNTAANQIINAYVPSPPTQVDHADGLYGHYGNAYGRYDGGYQYW